MAPRKKRIDDVDLSKDIKFKHKFVASIRRKCIKLEKEYRYFSDQSNQLLTLHRYFIWAERMRFHFERSLLIDDEPRLAKKDLLEEPHNLINGFMFMSLWYALLYSVVEGWKALKLQDGEVDRLLSAPDVSLLREYRNSALHFSKGMRMDDTILPGLWLTEKRPLGLLLRSRSPKREEIQSELTELLLSLKVGCRVATETSRGEIQFITLKTVIDLDQMTSFVLNKIGH
jgi:hypothetical protein